jgi:hypothetical protein
MAQSIIKNAVTANLLGAVEPGEGRWWKVELIKNVSTNPIKVTLMQSQVEGRTALSEPLGFTRTIATPEKVREAAELVLVMVGGYAKVIGDYLKGAN